MAKARAKADAVSTAEVNLKLEETTLFLLGQTPYIHHCLAEKARNELLIPAVKTKAARAQRLKHDVIAEYRASPYVSDDPEAPTRTVIPAVCFKRVIESMCLDVPGMTKAAVSRNIVAVGQWVSLYGIPQLKIDVVRSADMARTPDIRTRAVVPRWACKITLRYPVPLFSGKVICDLLSIGGQLRGVGDYRPERGAGSFGTFAIVPESDEDYRRVVREGGRAAQVAALDDPELYDEETRRQLDHFLAEVASRGAEEMATLPMRHVV